MINNRKTKPSDPMKSQKIFGSRPFLVISLLPIFIFLLFMGCDSPSTLVSADSSSTAQRSATPQPEVVVTSQTNAGISVELAPFDRFPLDNRFPLVFRFSSPVAPADRTSRENFAELSLAPNRAGVWSWNSDSELRFTPKDAWVPDEQISVELKGLLTSDGSQTHKPSFAPTEFKINLPKATAGLAKCELEIKNRAPLIQVHKIDIRFNYPVATDKLHNFIDFNLSVAKTGEANPAEKLNFTSAFRPNNLGVELKGPDIFRPEAN